MEVRSTTIRRALLVIVGGVFCYVFFYNSLLLDRRPIGKLISGSVAHGTTGRSVDSILQSGTNSSGGASLLRNPARGRTIAALNGSAAPPAPGLRLLGDVSPTAAEQRSQVGAQLVQHTTMKNRKTTTARQAPTTRETATTKSATAVGNYQAYGNPIGSMLDSGFRIPNEKLCPDDGKNQLVVILITTAPTHARQRRAIRQTWGSIALRRDVSLAFVVGRAKAEEHQLLDAEQATYGDLIQTNVFDAYRNLTLKTVAMLQWLDEYCAEAKIVLKTDDDMFINTENLLAFAQVHKLSRNAIFGRLGHRWKPIRNRKSKYYLSADNYPGKYLPDFLTGPAYVFTGDLIKTLYSETLKTPFLPLEDVLVTGVVGEKVKVKRIHSREFINDRIRIDTCKLQSAISIHMVKFDEQFDMWKRVSDGRTKCSKTYKPTGG